ncbi:hypothetical protein TWF481_011896 [Arthrobotrys musiformis]|uniref:SWIM-type domain-containing protein n=1 Tax=Arthrobotrys musiformis TaxID=47236 RepID=A0AAV9W1I9_9PEZI
MPPRKTMPVQVPAAEPTRRSARNIDRKEKKQKQEEEEARERERANAALPKATSGKSSKPAKATGVKTSRGGKKVEQQKKTTKAASQKTTAKVSGNKPNTKKPRKTKKQLLEEQEKGDEEVEGQESSEEEVAPAPKKKKAEKAVVPAQPPGKKRKAVAAPQPVAKKRKITISAKAKGKQKARIPSPEIEDGDEDEEPEEDEEESQEENEDEEDEEEVSPKTKRARTADSDTLPPFTLASLDTPSTNKITYNSSPSSDVPTVSIPPGFTVKVSAFEITHIDSKDNGYECNCKQYRSTTILKTCKHLLLLNGPRFEKKRLDEVKAKLDGTKAKSTSGVEADAPVGGEAEPSTPEEESVPATQEGGGDGQ